MLTDRSAARYMSMTPLVPVELGTRQVPPTSALPSQVSKRASEKSISARAS